ncbi:MAG: hypothetical protein WA919_06470 [Coleofasciculaceae cyanobacterium]
MLPELREQENELNSFTDEFLNDFINNQKARIQTRKSIEDFLLFIACQVGSASLALLLFQYAVSFWFTALLCQLIAWIPTFSSMDGFNFRKTQDGWEFTMGNRPFTTITKFISGAAFAGFGVYQIHQELEYTHDQINQVYREIKLAENPTVFDYLPEYTGFYVLSGLGIMLLVSLVKNLRDKNPF